MVSIVVDTDTASDDAVALLLAARWPGVTIRAVTTVAGNVPVDLATRNALATLEVVSADDVDVHPGLGAPLVRPLETAQHVHGANGMSGVELAPPTRSASGVHAVDALRHIARTEPGEHLLVTLGPLSNIATAVLIEPDVLERFTGVVSMAGAFDGVGNVHPVGEFNVWADPEAAAIVVDAPGDTWFVGWDISRRRAVLSPEDQRRLAELGPLGRFAVDINQSVASFAAAHTGLSGYDLPDPIAMAVALDRSLVLASEAVHVSIGLDAAGRGGTFVDHRLVARPANATVVRDVDGDRFMDMLVEVCRVS